MRNKSGIERQFSKRKSYIPMKVKALKGSGVPLVTRAPRCHQGRKENVSSTSFLSTRFLGTIMVLNLYLAFPLKARVSRSLPLKNGETIAWIGNSITHQCRYSQYVENYLFTRYPNQRHQFRSAGVSGDKAVDALDRFTKDIARYQPDYATILLGMNDGAYQKFDKATRNKTEMKY